MSKILCTFSGPYGDILWSLPTVRAISQMVGEKVDMATMPEYESLKPLIGYQSYIDEALVIPEWKCEGSPHGNQPWLPQVRMEKYYNMVFHLTYQAHPGIGGKRLPLIDFIAYQRGIKFVENPLPFIDVPPSLGLDCQGLPSPYVALAFNDRHPELKLRFLEMLRKANVPLVDVNQRPWLRSGSLIKNAICFVGCRSSNNVLAHGVGQKNIFIYEPDHNRKWDGPFGDVFGCPYGTEISCGDVEPEVAACNCIGWIEKWKAEKEKQYATA